MSVSNINSYIQEINQQMKKPIPEQLNDLKIAGAKVLETLDHFAGQLDSFDPDKITCEIDGQQVNCETWEPDNNHY